MGRRGVYAPPVRRYHPARTFDRRRAHVRPRHPRSHDLAPVRAVVRHRRCSRRQVDFASEPDPGGDGRGRDPDQWPAGRAGRSGHGQGDEGLRCRCRTPWRWRVAGQRCGCRRLRRAWQCHRLRQFRHRGAADHGIDGDQPDHRDLHRGCQPEQAAHGAGDRPAGAFRLPGGGPRGRAVADDAGGRGRARSGALRGAGALGAGEIRRAAGGAQCPRPDRGDRDGSDPRPYRADAGGLRGRDHCGGYR